MQAKFPSQTKVGYKQLTIHHDDSGHGGANRGGSNPVELAFNLPNLGVDVLSGDTSGNGQMLEESNHGFGVVVYQCQLIIQANHLDTFSSHDVKIANEQQPSSAW
jgi:hypothetical protein